MDQDYFYVSLPSGTVISYTTEKAAKSGAEAYGGKIIKPSKANPVEAGIAAGDPEPGLVAGPDTTAAVEAAPAEA